MVGERFWHQSDKEKLLVKAYYGVFNQKVTGSSNFKNGKSRQGAVQKRTLNNAVNPRSLWVPLKENINFVGWQLPLLLCIFPEGTNPCFFE